MYQSKTNSDFDAAFGYHENLNIGITENANLQALENKNYKPRTLIDNTLEYIDPTPNIHTLFVQFNARYFWNVLLPVEVKWSNRMTSCAGVCSFHPRNRQCVISLSAPLLKLRPRKDLIETLLHEMIHGYLFLTNNNRDRDGHGPEFCRHMNRINKEAGTNITIYHSFHNEVRLYQQHWWKCNGPCKNRPPYYGIVKRAMNRAPGPSDFWHAEHERSCGGKFIKIKEPEKPLKKLKTENQKKTVQSKTGITNINEWLLKNKDLKRKTDLHNTLSNTIPKAKSKVIPSQTGKINPTKGIQKIGNSSNNLYGFGIGGPKSTYSPQNSVELSTKNNNSPKFHSSGVLGGLNNKQSNLLDKFNITKPNNNVNILRNVKSAKISTLNDSNKPSAININVKLITCQVCHKQIDTNLANQHVSKCLDKKHNSLSPPLTKFKIENATRDSDVIICPVCYKSVELENINHHLDNLCSTNVITNLKSAKSVPDSYKVNDQNIIILDSSSDEESIENPINLLNSKVAMNNKCHNCLVCNELIKPGTSLSEHLDECIGSVFNDESMEFSDEENDKSIQSNTCTREEKYFCPICFKMIPNSEMNEHIDTCL
ncbi:DNA-dependent metalloprotease dvc-1 [Prorops nasuta]|uniref:DNA-dependent metalloprotease dvc-1 n=1 Tax=Prorops nasuta TaxID=863751 RepID=UPI0034CDCE60